MFDDVFGLTENCAETFRTGVRDAFGASIVTDVLEPIHVQINHLRSLSEDLERSFLNVEQLLQNARTMRTSGTVRQ